MRVQLLIVLLLVILNSLHAQEDPSELKELFEEIDSVSSQVIIDTIYVTEHLPMFKGGNEAFMKWLGTQTKLIKTREANINGKVKLSFTVSSEGVIIRDSIKVVHTTNAKLNNYATDILARSPRWIPGSRTQDNRRPPAPIDFRMSCIVYFGKQ